MSSASPASPASSAAKSVLLSKTLWVQVLALAAALVPAVQEWLAANPVEFVAAWAALNVLVRFATSGRVALGGADPTSVPPAASIALWFGAPALLASAALGLSGCTGAQDYQVSGAIGFIPADGAKAGLEFRDGHLTGFGRATFIDPATGETIAAGTIRVDRSSAK